MFKIIHHHFLWRWERFYSKNRWHLVLDLSLIIVIILLAACLIVWNLYNPQISLFGSNSKTVTRSSDIDLNNPPLDVSYSVANQVIKKDSKPVLNVRVKNKGESTADNLTIKLSSMDKNFSLDDIEIQDKGSKATLRGQDIVFSQLSPNENGSISVNVGFTARNTAARVVSWQASSEYSFDGKRYKEAVLLPSLKKAGELTAKAVAYYDSPQGDQLGVGPVPPIVGLSTSYWIFWEFKSTDDFKNLVFSARLPQGVEISSGRSLLAGEFNYNPSTRQLIWKIKEMKGGTDNARIGLELKLVPTAKQVGRILPLVTSMKFYAEDALTGEDVSGTLNSLTTNLDADRFNVGQGKVVSDK